MKIFTVGDPQFGDPQQEQRVISKILKLKNDGNIEPSDIMLIPGDLTDAGQNGTFLNKLLYRSCSCFYGESIDMSEQLNEFIKYVYNPCKNFFSDKVYICHGNHDEGGFPKKPVMDFVRKVHGALDYCVPVGEGVVLICLGKSYDKSKKSKFENWLEQNKDNKIIIMQHYYMEGPSQWDFWNNEDKVEFKRLIEPYKQNIVCVVEGHLHATYTKQIDGINYMNGSGVDYNVLIV